MSEVNENFKQAMSEWTEIKKRIASANDDMKIL
jgi:hypothetical protein